MTTTTNREKLLALSPFADGLIRAGAHHSLRAWWDGGDVLSDMTWLIGRAHVDGALTRRRLVIVTMACVETVAHLLPDEARPHLATVASWERGSDDVTAEDLRVARIALLEIRGADAATAAAYAATAAAYAAAADAAYAVAAAAIYAASATTAAATRDVIRDAITIDEVCEALGLDPDQGVM